MFEFTVRLFAVAIFIGLVTCEKEKNGISDNQKIYFEHYSINYAWGLQYLHWIIDGEGNVRVNSKTDSIVWLNENEMDKSISSFDSVIYKVDMNELIHYIDFIPFAAKGTIVCEDRNRADFGGTVFNCICCNKIILLSSMSDTEDCSNTNICATSIDKWLKNLHSKIYSKN